MALCEFMAAALSVSAPAGSEVSPLEYNDRDRARSLRLVVPVWRIHLRHLLPDLRAFIAVDNARCRSKAIAGDLNLDGTVNVLGDAFVLVANLGTPVTSWSQGDFNGDGMVTVLGDAFLFVANLGNTNSP